jgi:fructokinase
MTGGATVRIGVDLGGTKIEAVAIDDGSNVLARHRVPTPRSYDETLEAITGLVGAVERDTGRTGTVGVGIPGAVSPDSGLVKNANSTWLIGEPLGDDLARRLGRPVRLMNDANCFALSEATDGAAEGADVVFGVILGTGVGGGLVIGGRCIAGANLIAGEWGHNPLPWMTADEFPGPPCYCGKVGCIEMFLSGPGFERDHASASAIRRSGGALVAEATRSSRSIVEDAAAGDAAARATIDRYHDRLARAVASVINVLDPDVIVLGGGMSNLPGLAEATSTLLPRYVFSDTVVTRVVRNRHGDSSGVRGAAWLWPATS